MDLSGTSLTASSFGSEKSSPMFAASSPIDKLRREDWLGVTAETILIDQDGDADCLAVPGDTPVEEAVEVCPFICMRLLIATDPPAEPCSLPPHPARTRQRLL